MPETPFIHSLAGLSNETGKPIQSFRGSRVQHAATAWQLLGAEKAATERAVECQPSDIGYSCKGAILLTSEAAAQLRSHMWGQRVYPVNEEGCSESIQQPGQLRRKLSLLACSGCSPPMLVYGIARAFK